MLDESPNHDTNLSFANTILPLLCHTSHPVAPLNLTQLPFPYPNSAYPMCMLELTSFSSHWSLSAADKTYQPILGLRGYQLFLHLKCTRKRNFSGGRQLHLNCKIQLIVLLEKSKYF